MKYKKNSLIESFKNGAANGSISEPHFSDIISIMDTIECQEMERKMMKLIAA